MRPERPWSVPLRWTRRATSWTVALFLLAAVSSSVGCALFSKPSHVVGTERCPAMSEQAIAGWGDVYHMSPFGLKVWMGQIILYCEKVNAKLN